MRINRFSIPLRRPRLFLPLIFLLMASGIASGTSWTSVNGPSSAVVNSLAFNAYSTATTQNTYIIAGTNGGGIFRKTGSGNWGSVSTGLPPNAVVTTVVAGPLNVFAGTSDSGVFRSVDDIGSSWASLNASLPANSNVTGLVVHGTKIYAGIYGRGVYKSTNEGANWSASNGSGGNALANVNIKSLSAFWSGTAWTILAGTAGGGLYYSLNDGTTWAQATGFPGGATVTSIALTSDPDIVFAATKASGVYTSTNGGANWGPCGSSGLPASVNYVIARSLTILHAGTDSGIFSSTDSGVNWVPPTTGVGATSVNNIAIDPLSPASMFAGTSSGIFTSTDTGNIWASANTGLSYETDIKATAVDPNNPTIIYAGGSGSGAFKSTDSGANWSIANSGLGNLTINALLAKGTAIYAGTSSGVFKSTNAAGTWTSIVNGDLPSADVRALAVDTASSTVYAGTGSGIYKSLEAPVNWTATGTLTNPDVTSVAINSSNSDVYAGTAGSGVFRSSDSGTNWIQITDGFGGSTTINSLAIDTRTPVGIYAATTTGVFKWDTPSSSWTNVSSSFTSTDTRSMAIPSTPGSSLVFAGSLDGGLYLSSDSATNWISVVSGLPSPTPAIQSLAVDPGNPIKLYAGLSGRGVAKLTVTPILSVTSDFAIPLAYGTVFKDSVTLKAIKLTNTGSLPLNITAFNMDPATDFFADSGGTDPCPATPFAISPNLFCTMNMRFQPPTVGSSKTATLSILSNDVSNPTTTIGLQGAAVELSATITSPPLSPPPATPAFPCVYGTPISITGTATALGANLVKVQLNINNGGWIDVPGSSTSPWTYSWTAGADGTYTIQARTVADSASPADMSTPDCSAVDGTKGCLKVIVNNVLPVSAITSPTNGAKLQGGLRTITGTATDAGAGVQKVEISTDGGSTWTTVSGTTSWAYDWTPPSSNSYIIKSRATDNDSKVEAAPYPSVAVVVDSVVPSSSITAPLDNAVINGTSYTIRGTATDTGGSDLANTQVFIDGVPHAVTGALWTYPWTIAPNTFNTYTIYSQAADQAGNQEPVVPAAAITVTVDNIAPASAINTTPAYVAGTTFPLTGTATDTGVGISKVQISVNGGPWVDASGTAAWTYNWPVGTDGTYTFRSRAVDGAGNTEAPTASATVIVNNGPPSVNIVAPADNSAIGSANFTITGTASDTGAGIQTVEISIDGGAWNPATYNPSNGTWSYPWTIPGQEKPYTIRARATDNEGVASTTPTFTAVYDITPPVSAIVSPASEALLNGTSFTITGTSTDPFSPVGAGSGVQAVQVSFDGGTTWYPASTTNSWSTWSFTWTLPTVEQHPTIKSRALDKAGNLQPAFSADVHVYQVPPTSTITAPVAGSHLNGTGFTITGSATDLGLGIQKVEISTDGGATWNLATGTTSWSYHWQLPADGTYAILSKSTDLVGYIESSPSPISVIVDNTFPRTSISDMPPLYSNTVSPTFTFTASEQSTFKCSLDSTAFTSCTSPFTYAGLADGSHTFAVRATDLAGNTEPSPPSYTWTVDTINPEITAKTPADKAPRIGVTSTVSAVFSEAMDPATINTSTFTLNNGANGTVSYDASTTTATFSASPRLAYAATYTATIGAGATDLAGNPLVQIVWTFSTDPDGDIDLNGVVDIADAVLCLKYSISGKSLTAEELRHANVAPLKNGKPYPNGKIDIGDAVVILERVVGLVSW